MRYTFGQDQEEGRRKGKRGLLYLLDGDSDMAAAFNEHPQLCVRGTEVSQATPLAAKHHRSHPS